MDLGEMQQVTVDFYTAGLLVGPGKGQVVAPCT